MINKEKQILSKPVDIYKYTNPQVLTTLGEKLLSPFSAEENFRSANKTLTEFALSSAKKSKSWGSVHNGLAEAVTAFPSNSTLFSTSTFKNLHPCFVLPLFELISRMENQQNKRTQSSQGSSPLCNNTEKSL